MRNISDIRREAIRRESKVPELNPKEVAKDVKPLIQDVILISQKVALNKGLSVAISKKKKELMGVSDLAKRVENDISVEVDRLVTEAKNRATQLISQAQEKEKLAQKYLDSAKQKDSEIVGLSSRLKLLENKLKVEQENLKSENNLLKQREDTLKTEETSILNRKQETIESWLLASRVLLEAVKQLEQAQKIESEVSVEVSQTLAKADTIIQRTFALVKIQDAREKQLDQRAVELQKESKLLKDRRESLNRAVSEIKHKNA